MSKQDTGGPAFPERTFELDGQHNYVYSDENGMTLRDYFAGRALAGLYTEDMTEADIGKGCYAIADAMLKAREQ